MRNLMMKMIELVMVSQRTMKLSILADHLTGHLVYRNATTGASLGLRHKSTDRTMLMPDDALYKDHELLE